MGRSQETFNKKEVRNKKEKKRKEKLEKKLARKELEKTGKLEDMMAYLDEDGNITDTPPDPTKKKKVINAKSIEIGVPKKVDEGNVIRKGRVEFFNHEKGFGFIKEIDSFEKHFVHINGCIDEIDEGNTVTFDLERGMKGMNAVNVKKV